METVRGVVAAGSDRRFGFTGKSREKEEDEKEEDVPREKNDRGLSKEGGTFKYGQIDSSPMFNVIAAMAENQSRKLPANVGRGNGKQIDLRDVPLSDSQSVSATLTQAMESGTVEGRNIEIQIAGATGTPSSIKKLGRLVGGVKVVEVYSSSYNDFDVLGQHENWGGTQRDMEGLIDNIYAQPPAGKRMGVSLIAANSAEQKADLAAVAIRRSQANDAARGETSGHLIGSPNESSLVKVFLSSLRLALGGRENASKADLKFVDELEAKGLRIQGTIDVAKENLAKFQFSSQALKDAVADQVDRSRAITGPETAALAPKTSGQRLIVYATEAGLRGLSYDAGGNLAHMHATYMDMEGFSVEGRLQAWRRVDRNKVGAVRIEIVDRSLLSNRVEVAKETNVSEIQFGRRLDCLGTNGCPMSTEIRASCSATF